MRNQTLRRPCVNSRSSHHVSFRWHFVAEIAPYDQAHYGGREQLHRHSRENSKRDTVFHVDVVNEAQVARERHLRWN